jgi:RimJ/RimL family protein N-acetyltransferase
MGAAMQIPHLSTPRLILRASRAEDVEALYAFISDREVIRYFPRTEPWPRSSAERILASQQLQWEKHGFGWWLVERSEDTAFMGWCGLGYLDETGEVEIKYLFGKPFWGKGYASEAARASMDYALQHTALTSIIGLTHPENFASQHVLEKVGLHFKEEAAYFGMWMKKFELSRSQASISNRTAEQ